MWGSPLVIKTHQELAAKGLISLYPVNNFFQIGKPGNPEEKLPFELTFPEISFPLNRIPNFFGSSQYIEYLGYNETQAKNIFNEYIIKNPEALLNQFSLLTVSIKHLQNYVNAISGPNIFCQKASESGNLDGGFTFYGGLGLAINVKLDVIQLLESARKDEKVMDRYIVSFGGAKKFEDLIVLDFIIEIMDRRFVNLATFERQAKNFLEKK